VAPTESGYSTPEVANANQDLNPILTEPNVFVSKHFHQNSARQKKIAISCPICQKKNPILPTKNSNSENNFDTVPEALSLR